MTTTTDLFSVSTTLRRDPDVKPVVHAAAIGPGLLCGANRPTRTTTGAPKLPPVRTSRWWLGVEQVNCDRCIRAMADVVRSEVRRRAA